MILNNLSQQSNIVFLHKFLNVFLSVIILLLSSLKSLFNLFGISQTNDTIMHAYNFDSCDDSIAVFNNIANTFDNFILLFTKR